MPHIVVSHTADIADDIAIILPLLSQSLEDQGVALDGIKSYAVPIGAAVNAGTPNATLVHINLRVMRKSGRTHAVVTQWLRALTDIVTREIKTPHTLTAEANFLPEIYISATA